MLSEVAKTATYTHAYAESNGFLTIQPFPSFSEIHAAALKALRHKIATAPQPVATGS